MRPSVLLAANGDPAPAEFARMIAGVLGARVTTVAVDAVEEPDETLRVPAGARVEHASSAAAGLQRLIATERPVLTVLGSSHDAGHGRVALGGTAERVLHGAARAVAVVPRGHGERALGAIGVGLLPTPDALRALRAAASLSRAAGVPLLVLTVLRRSPDPADAALLAARLASAPPAPPRGSAASILRAAITAAAREDEDEAYADFAPPRRAGAAAPGRAGARADVASRGHADAAPPDFSAPGRAASARADFAARDHADAAPLDFSAPGWPSRRAATTPGADDLVVEPLVLVGDPADALVRATGRLGLLVLGSRGYGPPGVVLPGGAARRVLAEARCPVLLVPRAETRVTAAA